MSDDRWDAFETEMARRNPYGIHPEAKTGALAPLSHAARDGAENLLNKAIDSLVSGDSGRADRLISRAAAIPFDEHEKIWPGPMMADQMLFGFLSDIAEDSADAQEHPEEYDMVVWLHDDIARAADKLDAHERAVLRDVVDTIVSDASIIGVHPQEARGLAAVAKTLPGPDPTARGLYLPRETRADRREEVIRLHLSAFVKVLEAIDEGDAVRLAQYGG